MATLIHRFIPGGVRFLRQYALEMWRTIGTYYHRFCATWRTFRLVMTKLLIEFALCHNDDTLTHNLPWPSMVVIFTHTGRWIDAMARFIGPALIGYPIASTTLTLSWWYNRRNYSTAITGDPILWPSPHGLQWLPTILWEWSLKSFWLYTNTILSTFWLPFGVNCNRWLCGNQSTKRQISHSFTLDEFNTTEPAE